MKSLCLLLALVPMLYGEDLNESLEAPIEMPIEETVVLFEPNVFTNSPIEVEKLGPPPLIEIQKYKSSFKAVGLSFLAPGLGNIYLGDYKAGGGLLATSLASLGLELSKYQGVNFAIAQNTSFYGIYAAYRDVRIYNNDAGYLHKMPTDTLADLTKAPFRWKVLKKPEVWGGVLGALYLGRALSYYAFPEDAVDVSNFSAVRGLNPIAAFPVGIGEEAFFRGYLQSLLAETCTPVGGMILSSMFFGAAHLGNASFLKPEHQWRYYAFSIPYISLFGTYFSWLTYKNNSLQESVAVHSWYDFALFSISSIAAKAAIGARPEFNFSFSF